MGTAPKRPKIVRPDTEGERKKRTAAEERLRRALAGNRGSAANILAAADTFGTGKAARTLLGGADTLG